MQGFYVNMVYHSYALGDNSVLNEPAWVQDWVGLMKQVLLSDVCQVCLFLHSNSLNALCDGQQPSHTWAEDMTHVGLRTQSCQLLVASAAVLCLPGLPLRTQRFT